MTSARAANSGPTLLPRVSAPDRWRPHLAPAGTPCLRGGLRLSNPANVDDRTGVVLEPLAQVDDLRLVGQEVPIVVDHLVGEDRLVAGRRRHVAPHRPGAGGGLL